jgi:hypothetical protein
MTIGLKCIHHLPCRRTILKHEEKQILGLPEMKVLLHELKYKSGAFVDITRNPKRRNVADFQLLNDVHLTWTKSSRRSLHRCGRGPRSSSTTMRRSLPVDLIASSFWARSIAHVSGWPPFADPGVWRMWSYTRKDGARMPWQGIETDQPNQEEVGGSDDVAYPNHYSFKAQ